MIVARTTETPKYSKAYLEERYPGYTILGDRHGWFYPVESTRCVFVSVGWKSLVDDVRSHLKGNGLPVDPNLSLAMQDWWCREVSSDNCSEPPTPGLRDLTAWAERFLRTAKDYVFKGGQKVPQEEAERRAAICAKCPLNSKDGSFCATCFLRGMTASAVAMTTGWTSSRDSELHYCKNCGCKLALKIHLEREIMDHKEIRDGWWSGCWMRPTEAPSASETQAEEETL
jgi:hypothetical protein